MNIRTRFAPSPTGVLHIGSIRTALFCWLYARHHGGDFILRIEDTDRERSTQQNVDAILEGMSWLGLDIDEGPFFQTERLARYTEISEILLKSNNAYRCYCTKEELNLLRQRQLAAGEKVRSFCQVPLMNCRSIRQFLSLCAIGRPRPMGRRFILVQVRERLQTGEHLPAARG